MDGSSLLVVGGGFVAGLLVALLIIRRHATRVGFTWLVKLDIHEQGEARGHDGHPRRQKGPAMSDAQDPSQPDPSQPQEPEPQPEPEQPGDADELADEGLDKPEEPAGA